MRSNVTSTGRLGLVVCAALAALSLLITLPASSHAAPSPSALVASAPSAPVPAAPVAPGKASPTKADKAKPQLPTVALPYTFICPDCGLKITIKTPADWSKDCMTCACGKSNLGCYKSIKK